MDRLSLKAEERIVTGKKVRHLRKTGVTPGNVYGNKVESEAVSIDTKEFLRVYDQAGETGLIDLKIGAEKIRPVMVKNTDYDSVSGRLLHVDFYQVNLKEKVTVPVPVVILEPEQEIESVKSGEAVILQVLNEVQVEALPTDLIDQIDVNIISLKNVDDAITIGMLSYNREKLTIVAEPDEVVVKLAPAVTEEMKQLLEEQEAEVAAAAEAAEGEEGAEKAEGEEGEEVTPEGVEVAEGEGKIEEDSGEEKKE